MDVFYTPPDSISPDGTAWYLAPLELPPSALLSPTLPPLPPLIPPPPLPRLIPIPAAWRHSGDAHQASPSQSEMESDSLHLLQTQANNSAIQQIDTTTMSSNTSTTPTAADAPPTSQHAPAGNSSTYQSQGSTTLAKFQRLHNQGRIIGVTDSPFYPRSVQEYGEHLAKHAEDMTAEGKKKLENRVAAVAAIATSITERELKGEEKRREMLRMKVGKLMAPIDFAALADGKTAVLAKESIWGVGGAKEAKADWPSREEMKVEGEQQVRLRLPRRLPLPRENQLRDVDRSEMVNSGGEEEVRKMEAGEMAIPWRMKKVVDVEKFDETRLGKQARIAKGLEKDPMQKRKKDHIEQISEEEMLESGWLGRDLLDAMNGL